MVIVFFFLFISPVNAEKRALIVAIAEYPVNSGWRKINSDNDVPIIKSGLLKQGFPGNNIKVLLNTQATKAAIIREFGILTRNAKPGDIVYFHFSGHGQQVTDVDGDELDGWDEALVPYDALQENVTNEMYPSKHLIDDELNVLIKRLRKKCGKNGDILVCIDACHSGTIYRHLDDVIPAENDKNKIFRGTDEKYIINIPHDKTPNTTNKYNYEDFPQNQKDSEDLSSFLVISACSAEEKNYEYDDKDTNKRYGSLSYMLSSLFDQNIGNMSYTSFFESLKIGMASLGEYGYKQVPQMEGIAGREVFGGKAVKVPNHFTVKKLDAKEKSVAINGGILAGIKPETEIAFFSPDTYDITNAQPIQTAVVTSAGLTESILEFSPPCKIKSDSWAIVSKYTFPEGLEKKNRARIVRDVKSTNRDVILEFIPIDESGISQSIDTKKRNGTIEFFYNDRFDVMITNKSSVPLYFQLINVLPNDEIKLIKMGLMPNDFYVEPGKTKKIPLKITTGAPLGLEAIVLVASEDILNLSPVETLRGDNPDRYSLSEFEQFINDLYGQERSFYYPFRGISLDSKNYYVRYK